MLKYHQNRKLTECICKNCSQLFLKPITEYNRNISLNRNNFCSRKCSAIYNNSNRIKYICSNKMKIHLDCISSNRKDKYSLFRYTFNSIKRRFKEVNIDLEYLKLIWEQQNGICPYTKIKLYLPTYKDNIKDYTRRASLDRIDSNKGYIKDNVQFVSTSINLMKNNMSSNQVIEFLNIIVKNLSV